MSNVINFDFPLDLNSYIHRVGRTARGKNQGTALSFVAIRERPLMEEVEQELKHTYNCESLFKTYQFKLEEVEGFRYIQSDFSDFTVISINIFFAEECRHSYLNYIFFLILYRIFFTLTLF